MNWLDLLIIALLLFFVIEAIKKSFVLEVIDFFSFLLSFFISLRFYNLAAAFFQSNFQIPRSLSSVLGFISIWFITEMILFLLVQLSLPRLKIISVIDAKLKHLTILPAFLRGLVFISIILVLVGTFPIQPKIKLAVQESFLGSRILAQTQQLETPLKKVFGGITEDTLAFLTIKPKSDETIKLGFQTTDFKPNPDLENRMIILVNKERTSRGLKPLGFDNSLREVARSHSKDMFERGYFSHFSPEGETVSERAQRYGVDYSVIGENLAYAPGLELAHNGLMQSPGHRANILAEDFSLVGIGIMDSKLYGLMITQVFKN